MENVRLFIPDVGVIPNEGFLAFASVDLYSVTVSSTLISANGASLKVTLSGTEEPPFTHFPADSVLTVAYTPSTNTKKFGRSVKTAVPVSVFLNEA